MFGAGHGRAARRRRRGRRGASLRRGARLQGDLPRAGDGEPPAVAPPRVRPAVGRDRAPRRADRVPRRRPDVPQARLQPRGARQADAVAHVQPAARHPVRDRVLLRRRHPRALPRPARSRCSRATARGRRGSSTASTSTTSGPVGTRRPSSRCRRRSTSSATAGSRSRPTRSTVPHFIDTFGDDKLVFSTDYPHGDSKFPHAVDAFDKLPMTDESQGRDREHQLVGPLQDPAGQAGLRATGPRPRRAS